MLLQIMTEYNQTFIWAYEHKLVDTRLYESTT